MKTLITVGPHLHIENVLDVINEPKVIRIKDVDDRGLEDFERDMSRAHQTGQPVIPVVIDSFGGGTYECLGIVSCIQQAKVPVATIVTSKAMSAGAIIFGFGTEGYRFMDPNAVLMIHELASYTEGKIGDIKVNTKHLEVLDRNLYKRLAQHLGHPSEYFLDIIDQKHHHDWYLTAKEAKRHKLVNHLTIPHFEVEIAAATKFVI